MKNVLFCIKIHEKYIKTQEKIKNVDVKQMNCSTNNTLETQRLYLPCMAAWSLVWRRRWTCCRSWRFLRGSSRWVKRWPWRRRIPRRCRCGPSPRTRSGTCGRGWTPGGRSAGRWPCGWWPTSRPCPSPWSTPCRWSRDRWALWAPTNWERIRSGH